MPAGRCVPVPISWIVNPAINTPSNGLQIEWQQALSHQENDRWDPPFQLPVEQTANEIAFPAVSPCVHIDVASEFTGGRFLRCPFKQVGPPTAPFCRTVHRPLPSGPHSFRALLQVGVRFRPSFMLHNLLPVGVCCRFLRTRKAQGVPDKEVVETEIVISRGQSCDVLQVSGSELRVQLSFVLTGERNGTAGAERAWVSCTSQVWSAPLEIRCGTQAVFQASSATDLPPFQTVHAKYTSAPADGPNSDCALHLRLFCPFWAVNATDLSLSFRSADHPALREFSEAEQCEAWSSLGVLQDDMPVLIPLLGPKPLMQIRATPPDSNPDQSEATCAQARQRTLPSFRWPFPPPPHRLRSHRTCNEQLRLVRWQWPVTPAGKAQLWSQKFDGDALTSGGQIDIGDDALGMAIQVPRPPVRLDDTQ